jgi:predicted metal-dependent hydrolase
MSRFPTIIKIGNFRFRIVKRRKIVRRKRVKNQAQYLEYKEQARELVIERLAHFNRFYNFEYKKVAIRNQSSRWGSCSSKANLNFNYRVVFLPPPLLDYLIVHELCHLQEFNHGPNFWALVAKAIPDYLERRVALKKIRLK